MAIVTCTRHKTNFSADAHRDCPMCEVEGVTSLSAQRQLREIAKRPPEPFYGVDMFIFNPFNPWLTP
jgi:hypothetical protein